MNERKELRERLQEAGEEMGFKRISFGHGPIDNAKSNTEPTMDTIRARLDEQIREADNRASIWSQVGEQLRVIRERLLR